MAEPLDFDQLPPDIQERVKKATAGDKPTSGHPLNQDILPSRQHLPRLSVEDMQLIATGDKEVLDRVRKATEVLAKEK